MTGNIWKKSRVFHSRTNKNEHMLDEHRVGDPLASVMETRANVQYVTSNDFVLARDVNHVNHVFPASKVEGYAGEALHDFGLRVGDDIMISIVDGNVEKAVLASE